MRFRFFDYIALDVELEAVPNDNPKITGIYAHFLDRGEDKDPRATFHGDPNPRTAAEEGGPFFTWHLSSNRGRKSLHTWFGKLSPATFEETMWTSLGHLAAGYPGKLELVDFAKLEAEGWSVHGVRFDVVHRWVRAIAQRDVVVVKDKPTKQVHVTPCSLRALAMHVFRQRVPISEVKAFAAPHPAGLIALRAAGDRSIESRVLRYIPEASPLVGSEQVPCGGWYFEGSGAPASERPAVPPADLPINAFGDALTKIQAFLASHPRNPGAADEDLLFAWMRACAETAPIATVVSTYVRDFILLFTDVDLEVS